MATRRSRIVVKPNIKPLGIKATSHAKAKPTSKESVPESTAASTLKQPDPSGSQLESGATALSIPKQGKAPDKAVNQTDVTDSTVHEISVRGSKGTDEGHDGEVSSNNKSRISSNDIPGTSDVGNLKKGDTASATEVISTSTKSQDSVSDHGKSSHPVEDVQPSLGDKLLHSKVVAPKSVSEVSSRPEFSQPLGIGETVTPMESEAIGSNQKGDEAAPTKVADGGLGPETASQAARTEELEVVQEEEIPEKRKRPRGREKKERSEPLPPSDRSPDRQKMKMSDLLSWNPSQNFLPKKKKTSTSKVEVRSKPPESSITMDDEASNQSASLPAPQVMIGSDGNIVLNTESLMVGAPKNDGPKEIIEENDEDRYLNTNSYRQTTRAKLWTEKEDEKFFLGLSMCGTDFSLMCKLMPKRSRKELKNKFRREEKRNRVLIDKALSNRQRYDPTPFEKMAAEEARLQEQIKAEADRKKLSKQKASVKKEKTKPSKSTTTKKPKKRKKKEPKSEDEEDDYGDDYDDDDEENLVQNDPIETPPKISTAKKKKQAKTRPFPKQELIYPNKPGACSTSGTTPSFLEAVQSQQTAPHHNSRKSDRVEKTLSSPKKSASQGHMERPPLPHSNSITQSSTAEAHTHSNPSVAASSFSRLQSIPGSSPIQIVMEGINNVLQGVLIPSHILPHVAPHLGIPPTNTPMQVLLVQEESSAGSMVHVYMVPEGDCQPGPPPPAAQGDTNNSSNPGGSLTLKSPVPRPPPLIRPLQHPANSQPPVNPVTPLSHPSQPHSNNTSLQVPHSHPSAHPESSQPNQSNPSSQTSHTQPVIQANRHDMPPNQLNPSNQTLQSRPRNPSDHSGMQSNQLNPSTQMSQSQPLNPPSHHGMQPNHSSPSTQMSQSQPMNPPSHQGMQSNQLNPASHTLQSQPTTQSDHSGVQSNPSSHMSQSQPTNQSGHFGMHPNQLNPKDQTSQSQTQATHQPDHSSIDPNHLNPTNRTSNSQSVTQPDDLGKQPDQVSPSSQNLQPSEQSTRAGTLNVPVQVSQPNTTLNSSSSTQPPESQI